MSEEPETTNKVLEVKIDGLTKTTEIQLGHVNETLKDVKIQLNGFATKVEVEERLKDVFKDIKEIKENFVQHNIDDKESFGDIAKGQQKVRDTVVRWGGIFGAILFLATLLSPLVYHYVFRF